MTTYVRKEHEVEAFCVNVDNADLFSYLVDRQKTFSVVDGVRVHILTNQGELVLNKGDWLIIERRGNTLHYFAVDSVIFNRDYKQRQS